MRKLLLPLAAVALATAACATRPPSSGERAAVPPTPQAAEAAIETDPGAPGAPRQALKGYELYSWREPQGEWRYALLLGTNRLKSSQEIHAAGISEPELRSRLAGLAPAESVSWCPPPGVETDPPLAMPPAPVVDSLVALARERDIRLATCSD